MSDDYQNRPGVNLEELERQLRVASRAHVNATGAPTPLDEKPLSIPDIEALRRDFGRTREPASQPKPSMSESGFQPGPPPAFLSQPAGYAPSPPVQIHYDDRFPVIDRNRQKGSVIFRTLFSCIVAMLMLTFGYFFYSGKLSLNVSVAPDQKAVPVIKADPNPVKIVPEAVNPDEAAQSGSELFGKKNSDTVPPTSTRAAAEAPVDVNAVVKGAGSKVAPLIPGMGEPKAVRTVTVRPDGTLIGEQPAPTTQQNSNAAPVVATPPAAAMTQEPQAPVAPVAAPAAPVVPAKPVVAAPTPDPMPALPPAPAEAPLIGGLPVPLPVPRPADVGGKLGVVPATADPLDALVAAATSSEPDTDVEAIMPQPSASPSGDYGVQFGASPSEAEANSLLAKLKAPLAELLAGHPLTVVKGDSNGKTVYRVRALGYSRDEAAATCATSTAAGTKCFIAKN